MTIPRRDYRRKTQFRRQISVVNRLILTRCNLFGMELVYSDKIIFLHDLTFCYENEIIVGCALQPFPRP